MYLTENENITYIDDILIFSHDQSSCMKDIQTITEVLQNNFKILLTKSIFDVTFILV